MFTIHFNLYLERCSMTLLTLSTPYVMSCGVCSRKILDKRVFTEDSAWVDFMVPDGCEKDLPVAENCLYCSGELLRLSSNTSSS
jgi:hypothetical protein